MSDFPPEYDKLDEDALWVECPDCEGEGWVGPFIEDRDMCPKCQGRGEVPNDQLPEDVQASLLAERNRY